MADRSAGAFLELGTLPVIITDKTRDLNSHLNRIGSVRIRKDQTFACRLTYHYRSQWIKAIILILYTMFVVAKE